MICGTCREPFTDFTAWRKHILETGCNWHRPAWDKHLAARRRGSSGRRHLSRVMPRLWPPGPPMTEEKKEELREIGKNKIKVKKSNVQKIREAAAEAKRKKRKKRRKPKGRRKVTA